MLNIFNRTPVPENTGIEQRQYISALKRRMEKLLREQGISRAKATEIVSRTFKEALQNERP